MHPVAHESFEAKHLLKLEYLSRKEKNSRYSLRGFAKSLEMSPAHLSQLMSGKRNFTAPVLRQLAAKLALSPESERSMIAQTLSSGSPEERGRKDRMRLAEDEFRLISDWYHFAILSLTKVRGAKTDPAWIAERLGLSVPEAKEALSRLQRLGILEEGPRLKQKCPPLSVVSEVPSRAIQNYHRQILDVASERLTEVPPAKRDYSALTFAGDASKVEAMRPLIEEFQDRVQSLMGESPGKKEVFILSCQLFPVERNSP